jgi:hypothetical protein
MINTIAINNHIQTALEIQVPFSKDQNFEEDSALETKALKLTNCSDGRIKKYKPKIFKNIIHLRHEPVDQEINNVSSAH